MQPVRLRSFLEKTARPSRISSISVRRSSSCAASAASSSVKFVSVDFWELAEALLDALDLGGEVGRNLGRFWLDPRVLGQHPVFGIEHGFGPGPLRAQFFGLGFELLDREAVHQRRIVEEAVLVAGEEIARDLAAGGLIGLGADELAEIGIQRHRARGQQALHRVGLDVRIGLELVPHGELRRMVGAEGEGSHHIEADVAVAVGVEQFRREFAEPQALPDVPFRGAEALRDRIDCGAAVDQFGHGDKLVGRVHRGAYRVFDKRTLERLAGAFDLAGDRIIGLDRAFGGELLQDLEPPAAGIDLVDAFIVDGRWMDDQVLFDAVGADAGFEGGILGRRRRCLADIGRGQNEQAEGDVADFAASGHGGDSLTGGRETSLALENPSPNPLSVLFL